MVNKHTEIIQPSCKQKKDKLKLIEQNHYLSIGLTKVFIFLKSKEVNEVDIPR